MNYTVGVYSDEYLLLLELMGRFDREMPEANVRIYGTEALIEELPGEAADQISSDLGGLVDNDIVVLLGKLPDPLGFRKNYGGVVIDVSETVVGERVVRVADPLVSLLCEIASVNEGMSVTLGLPLAVYGREGVDMLMQETRSVYTFDDYNDSVLPMRIAFNIHFYKDDLPHNKLGTPLGKLRKLVNRLSLRIYPVSTMFVADLYAPGEIEIPEGLDLLKPEGDFSLEDVSRDERITAITADDGRICTLTGDYLHLRTAAILHAVKSARGGDRQ